MVQPTYFKSRQVTPYGWVSGREALKTVSLPLIFKIRKTDEPPCDSLAYRYRQQLIPLYTVYLAHYQDVHHLTFPTLKKLLNLYSLNKTDEPPCNFNIIKINFKNDNKNNRLTSTVTPTNVKTCAGGISLGTYR